MPESGTREPLVPAEHTRGKCPHPETSGAPAGQTLPSAGWIRPLGHFLWDLWIRAMISKLLRMRTTFQCKTSEVYLYSYFLAIGEENSHTKQNVLMHYCNV